MKMFAITVISVGALSAATVGLAGPATAAGGADVTVNGLTSEGYSVQLNGAPTANLSACSVTGVKKDGIGGPSPTAYVDIACPDGC